MLQHKIVSQSEWTAQRKAFLAREKEFTRARDQLSAERRKLPWVKVDKAYVFDTPNGKKTLAELFDEQESACWSTISCLAQAGRKAAPAALISPTISTAPLPTCRSATWHSSWSPARRSPEIEAFKQRMGWRFKWVSSFGSDFNFDYHVSFPEKQVGVRGRVQLRKGRDRKRRDARSERLLQRPDRRPSFTPIPPTPGGSTSSSALTTGSISRPKAATRPSCPGPWLGCAATMSTAKTQSSRAADRIDELSAA